MRTILLLASLMSGGNRQVVVRLPLLYAKLLRYLCFLLRAFWLHSGSGCIQMPVPLAGQAELALILLPFSLF